MILWNVKDVINTLQQNQLAVKFNFLTDVTVRPVSQYNFTSYYTPYIFMPLLL